jgi:hypothetical protein
MWDHVNAEEVAYLKSGWPAAELMSPSADVANASITNRTRASTSKEDGKASNSLQRGCPICFAAALPTLKTSVQLLPQSETLSAMQRKSYTSQFQCQITEIVQPRSTYLKAPLSSVISWSGLAQMQYWPSHNLLQRSRKHWRGIFNVPTTWLSMSTQQRAPSRGHADLRHSWGYVKSNKGNAWAEQTRYARMLEYEQFSWCLLQDLANKRWTKQIQGVSLSAHSYYSRI